MESIIKELWHGNIVPQSDSRNNSKEMKELLGYIAGITRNSKRTSRTSRKKYSKNSTIVGMSTQRFRKKQSSPTHSN